MNRSQINKENFKNFLSNLGILMTKLIILFLVISTLQVIIYKWIDPGISAVIIQRKIESIFSGKKIINYRWYNFDQISKNFAIAVIASEDQNFPFHLGFDFEQINQAIKEQKIRGRLRGASTISQQTAKNLFLWEGKSFIRKVFEAYYTILIESIWSKRRILEVYMNIAETGNNIFGIGVASKKYFTKHPLKITSEECALIAAILPNPKRFSVTIPSNYILKRQQWILEQMESLGGVLYIEDYLEK